MSRDRLIFVYNADEGVVAGLLDLVHKTVSPSTYQCSLCGVTYGPLGMKRRWRDWLKALPMEAVFYHRPDFRAAYPGLAAAPLPLVAIDRAGTASMLLDAATLATATDLDSLIALLEARLS